MSLTSSISFFFAIPVISRTPQVVETHVSVAREATQVVGESYPWVTSIAPQAAPPVRRSKTADHQRQSDGKRGSQTADHHGSSVSDRPKGVVRPKNARDRAVSEVRQGAVPSTIPIMTGSALRRSDAQKCTPGIGEIRREHAARPMGEPTGVDGSDMRGWAKPSREACAPNQSCHRHSSAAIESTRGIH